MKIAIKVLVLSLLIPTMVVFAKGDFDHIVVKGPGIAGELDVANPALTQDFFAFADFSKGSIAPPAEPGQSYQIIRVYIVDNKDQPFDQLHYYPYTGYVYYDGIFNGSSEYDGKWYTASPSANGPFRNTLAQRARLNWISFGVLVVILGWFFIAYRSKSKKE